MEKQREQEARDFQFVLAGGTTDMGKAALEIAGNPEPIALAHVRIHHDETADGKQVQETGDSGAGSSGVPTTPVVVKAVRADPEELERARQQAIELAARGR